MMKKLFRKPFLSFRDRIYYIFNYKTHLQNEEFKDADIKRLNEEIEKLKDKIIRLEIYNEVKDNLLEKKEQKIIELKLDIIKISKKIKEKINE